MIKSDEEINKIRIAGQLAAQTLEMIKPYIKPGVTTEEINNICHNFITKEQQAIPAPLNYNGFPKSICTSINHVVCHGIPANKALRHGDILNIDVTVIKNGYHGDTSAMFCVGEPSILAKKLIECTYECLLLAIDIVKPGTTLGDIGHVIQQHAEKKHYSVVREYCGHGIGKNFHAEPQILHYGTPNTGMKLEKGMVFTIEPMINAGKRNVKLLPDNWTVVTKDKSLSAQWEHTIAVTENGAEVLTKRPDESF
jgi:methionyl aminopeptidase